MPFLFDTCAISEFVQTRPNAKVIEYLSSLPNHETYISAISLGEILYGIELLPQSARRRRLADWYANWVVPSFGGRVLAHDHAMMEIWGPLMARMDRKGFKLQIKDSLIAACALANELTLITRNEGDFEHCGVKLINPWNL